MCGFVRYDEDYKVEEPTPFTLPPTTAFLLLQELQSSPSHFSVLNERRTHTLHPHSRILSPTPADLTGTRFPVFASLDNYLAKGHTRYIISVNVGFETHAGAVFLDPTTTAFQSDGVGKVTSLHPHLYNPNPLHSLSPFGLPLLFDILNSSPPPLCPSFLAFISFLPSSIHTPPPPPNPLLYAFLKVNL